MDSKQIERLLRAPFPETSIEWRVQKCGVGQRGPWALVVPYIDARAIQHRLDDVFGMDGWAVEYREWHAGRKVWDKNQTIESDVLAQICRISVRVGDRWVSREDGAECTDIEKIKGGLSSAFKRAAVLFGIGAYLYDLDEIWADCSWDRQNGWRVQRLKDGQQWRTFYWRPKPLPSHALPEGTEKRPQDASPQSPPQGQTQDQTQETTTGDDFNSWWIQNRPRWWDRLKDSIPHPRQQDLGGTSVSDWRTVECHHRFRVDRENRRIIPLPTVQLGQMEPDHVKKMADHFYLPENPIDQDYILRAALNLYLQEQENGGSQQEPTIF